MVAVGASDRLIDDLVDEAERLQACGGDAHRLRSIGRLVGALPQDGGTTFGRNHRISRVLQHQHLIADRDRQRATGAAFTDDGADDGHARLGHQIRTVADRLGLATLFGADARIGPACR